MYKKMFYPVALVLVLAIGGAAQAGLAEWEAAISGANPLHWYKFDETGADCIDSGSGGLNGVYEGVVMAQEGLFGPGTAVGFERNGANRANFANATDMPGPYTVEYIVKTTKPPAANDSQALHDSDATSIRLAGWTALGEVGFTLYGVADYRFTPIAGYTLNDLVIQPDEWVHLTWRNDGTGTQFFLNGKMVGTSTDSVALPRLRIGARGAGPADHLMGVLDEAVVFNRALSDEDIVAHSDASTLLDPTVLGAGNPDPADGVILAATWVSLSWSAGGTATSHDVYFSDNFDDVDQGTGDAVRGNQAATTFIAGFVGFPYPDGLVPGTTYYWRIDEVDPQTTYRGQIWSFLVPPRTAYNPSPADGAKYVAQDASLAWTGGFDAKLHTVYFSDNFEEVDSATGGLPQSTRTFTPPGPLAKDTVYHWRVDEFDGATTHKGNVWSFATLPTVEITDPDLVGWWTLDEDQGAVAVDWSGHGNEGTLEGNPQWVEGKIGPALAFAGNRVIISASDSLTADLFQGSFTLAGWINPKRTGNTWQQIFRAVIAGGSNDTLFINNDGRLSWRGRVGGAWAGGMCETAAEVVPANTWTHFAVTGDGTSFRIYVGGVLSQESAFQQTDGANVTYYIGGTAGGESYSGMVDDLRVYNKVLTADEIKQVMRGDPLVAWDASPANRSNPDIDNALPLGWQPGDNASQHDVYFGTDVDAVTDADASDTTGVYRGRQNGTAFTPSEGVEWGGGPYHWRVDEVNKDGSITKGRIWSFTVADFLLVDDFESYTDNDAENEAIWQHWIDGYGVPTNGSQVGNLLPPYAERGNVHGGAQAMPLAYDNTLGVTHSEAALKLTSRLDWTAHGVAVLSLWFHGAPANGADSLYVAAKNANGQPVVVNHPDAGAAQINAWTEWVITLQTFADRGMNLANVDEIIIGLGAKGTSSAASGTGQMLIDDIRLFRP